MNNRQMDFSLHILDLFQNSVDAEACFINLRVEMTDYTLTFVLKDDGHGMSEEKIKSVLAKEISPGSGKGNGIPMAADFARKHGGEFSIEPNDEDGICCLMSMPRQNMTRKDFGNLTDTVMCMMMKAAEENWESMVDFRMDLESFEGNLHMDTFLLRRELAAQEMTLDDYMRKFSKRIRHDLDDKIRIIFGGIE